MICDKVFHSLTPTTKTYLDNCSSRKEAKNIKRYDFQQRMNIKRELFSRLFRRGIIRFFGFGSLWELNDYV